ncbi:MAG TPA: phenylalanine--tRNA ligase subunit beta [Chloroflexota bacterium]|nr:phenylalanine--tRNA ligase subunit beta [Chloroflexota bacterium]
MKVPLLWLADYVELPAAVDQLAYRLTMTGTEVEDVVDPARDWQDVRVAEVTGLERPPGSERVQKAVLDVGDGEIVALTAAPNIAVGQRIAYVPVRGIVPRGPEGEPFVLQPRPMFGINGEAMVLSERELGLSEAHSGILVLTPDVPIGSPLSDLMGHPVLDIAVQANRPDHMAILGVAREISAVTERPLRPPSLEDPHRVDRINEPSARVEIADYDLCSRYAALRIDIRVGASPSWLTARLEAAGVRSINNVVDVTNFVMLELGQPLHAFDYDKLAAHHIIVRRSTHGEHLRTLDGVDRQLPEGTLLITDESGPIAVAGIMGGAETEVSDSTTTILVESACFDGPSVRRASRLLGLRTEASARFERGVAPELADLALKRCLHLLASTTEDRLTVALHVDEHQLLVGRPLIDVPESEFARLLGVEVGPDDAAQVLERLGFTVEITESSLRVLPPYWRLDIEGPADIAEEVARMMGYDSIPETLPFPETQPPALPLELRTEAAVREILLGAHLSETWNDTLTSPASMGRLISQQDQAEPWDWERVVANPEGVHAEGAMAEILPLINAQTIDRSVLRLTLVPSILDVIGRNLKHTRERLAFFELARTFFPRVGALPYERRTLALGLCGEREPRSWLSGEAEYDFFDLKGILTLVLRRLGIRGAEGQQWEVRRFPESRSHPGLHPGRSGELWVDERLIGYLGELHPAVAPKFEIDVPMRALVAEIDLDSLKLQDSVLPEIHSIPRYPSVHRDISLIVAESVSASEIERVIRESASDTLKDVRVVDVYHGANVEPGAKSITLGLQFQSDTRTLTQEEVSGLQDAIVASLEERLSARLRV